MNQRGFSIFELIVYIAIFALLITAIISIAVQSLTSKTKAKAMAEVEQSARYAVERITIDVRMASNINNTDLASNVLTITQGTDTITYQVSGTQLTRSVNSATAIPITPSTVTVDTFTLINTTPVGTNVHDISVTLGVSTTSSTGRPEYDAALTLQTAMSVRL